MSLKQKQQLKEHRQSLINKKKDCDVEHVKNCSQCNNLFFNGNKKSLVCQNCITSHFCLDIKKKYNCIFCNNIFSSVYPWVSHCKDCWKVCNS